MPFGREPLRPRLMVVEDDPLILELITTRLELAGFQTFYAREGQEGLRRIAEVRPDGLILDINMPVMDGFQVLRALRDDKTAYKPRTLVLTARNRPEDVKTAMDLGARDFIAKPFDDQQLILRVGRLLRRRHPAEGDQAGAPDPARILRV